MISTAVFFLCFFRHIAIAVTTAIAITGAIAFSTTGSENTSRFQPIEYQVKIGNFGIGIDLIDKFKIAFRGVFMTNDVQGKAGELVKQSGIRYQTNRWRIDDNEVVLPF